MDAAQRRINSVRAEQELAEADALSSVLRRRTGLAALQRELDRAHRTDSALTAAVIDVAGRTASEGQGHGADAETTPLHCVACALLGSVRSYDLVICVGGDGFVCALCDVAISGARRRFGAVQEALAQTGILVAIGCAELAPSDTPATLIDRAGADARRARSPPGRVVDPDIAR